MKFSVILMICAVVVSCGAQDDLCTGEYLRNVSRKCVAAFGVGQVELDKFIYNGLADSQNEKCFRACIYHECQYFNTDGSLRDDTPIRAAYSLSRGDPSKIKAIQQIATDCLYATPVWDNICDTTDAFERCMVKNSPNQLTLEGNF